MAVPAPKDLSRLNRSLPSVRSRNLGTEDLKKQALVLALSLGRRAMLAWVAVVILFFLALAIWVLKAVHLVATITAVSTLLAYVIAPAVQYLSERRGMPRTAAISLVYALGGLAFLLTLAYLVPAIQSQFLSLTAHIGTYLHTLQETLDASLAYAKANAPSFLKGPLSQIDPESVKLEVLTRDLQEMAPAYVASGFMGVFSGVKAAFGVIAGTVLIPLFTFYILMDGKKYGEAVVRLFPRRWKADIQELLNLIDQVLGRYIRGQILVCLTIGVSIAILLSVLGVPYAILIGAFAGVVDIIPYVGVAMGMVPAFLIALSHKGLFFAILVVVLMEVVHWTEGHIIVPAIIGQSVGLPPLVVMIALGAGAELGGVMGMFLSMPLAAILRVILQFYVSKLEAMEAGEEISETTTNGPTAVEAAPAAGNSEV